MSICRFKNKSCLSPVLLNHTLKKDGDEETKMRGASRCVSPVGSVVNSNLYSLRCSVPQTLSFCSCCYTGSFVLEPNTQHIHSVSALTQPLSARVAVEREREKIIKLQCAVILFTRCCQSDPRVAKQSHGFLVTHTLPPLDREEHIIQRPSLAWCFTAKLINRFLIGVISRSRALTRDARTPWCVVRVLSCRTSMRDIVFSV